MKTRLPLCREQFHATPTTLLQNAEFHVELFRYPAGIEAVRISNQRGTVTVLPFYGQMIWDACFDGHRLTMGHSFKQPLPGSSIIDTYGCFAFHSGLLANGCPAEDDDHPLHGEMACARMDSAWLVLEADRLSLEGETEYVKGFGHHYLAAPAVRVEAGQPRLHIEMNVTNLAGAPMPLQYMCHLNSAWIDEGEFKQSIPQQAFQLRTSVPAHVKPTLPWQTYTAALARDPQAFQRLDRPEMCDPEIVFFADDLPRYGDEMQFELHSPQGFALMTRFSSRQFPHATRWMLHNRDQQVAAYILPATCRPEGFNAAQRAGTLLSLAPGEQRHFSVETGIL
ncbi:MAG: aldose 1-epimerase family protein [Pantoea sp.]|uniref:aldose 1-epimerase family protein n=1 Tax=Pantoea septica TaxID=472695 RepID=UPI001C1267FD|nr:aldose 1-epimerase family protein [Pantoea septica]MBU5377566.1 aldose 1-epimerase family protein [Pantoea septica]MDU5839332.1 aldose 1-epimerase family protein [Pantoea sp.]MDU6441862.1 aldose 1-epimerase family protein [Pantoea sp.]